MEKTLLRGAARIGMLLLLLVSVALPGVGQPAGGGQLIIKGKVVERDSIGLPGVNVLIAGTTFGSSTTIDGTYAISVPDSLIRKLPAGPIVLRASFVGYQSILYALNQNRPNLAAGQRLEIVAKPISLTEEQNYHGEVVMAGYGAHPAVPSLEWPPPQPSTQCDLPAAFLIGAKKLKDVDASLVTSLERAGYSYRSYYAVPDGFALVTQLEQTNDEAYPRPEPDRWSEDMPQTRKLSDWIRNAFIANKGHYRLLVFTVTPRAFVPTTRKLTKKQAGLWLASGLSALPEFIGKRSYTSSCKVTVLVYEYLRKEGNEQAVQVLPSLFSAPTHLSRAGIKP